MELTYGIDVTHLLADQRTVWCSQVVGPVCVGCHDNKCHIDWSPHVTLHWEGVLAFSTWHSQHSRDGVCRVDESLVDEVPVYHSISWSWRLPYQGQRAIGYIIYFYIITAQTGWCWNRWGKDVIYQLVLQTSRKQHHF